MNQLGNSVIFSENEENKVLCKLTLKNEDIQRLRDAIEDLYYYEFVIGLFFQIPKPLIYISQS